MFSQSSQVTCIHACFNHNFYLIFSLVHNLINYSCVLSPCFNLLISCRGCCWLRMAKVRGIHKPRLLLCYWSSSWIPNGMVLSPRSYGTFTLLCLCCLSTPTGHRRKSTTCLFIIYIHSDNSILGISCTSIGTESFFKIHSLH